MFSATGLAYLPSFLQFFSVAQVPPTNLLGFARAGWTEAAQQSAQAFASNPSRGPNWQGVMPTLLELTQVDADLCTWAENG